MMIILIPILISISAPAIETDGPKTFSKLVEKSKKISTKKDQDQFKIQVKDAIEKLKKRALPDEKSDLEQWEVITLLEEIIKLDAEAFTCEEKLAKLKLYGYDPKEPVENQPMVEEAAQILKSLCKIEPVQQSI